MKKTKKKEKRKTKEKEGKKNYAKAFLIQSRTNVLMLQYLHINCVAIFLLLFFFNHLANECGLYVVCRFNFCICFCAWNIIFSFSFSFSFTIILFLFFFFFVSNQNLATYFDYLRVSCWWWWWCWWWCCTIILVTKLFKMFECLSYLCYRRIFQVVYLYAEAWAFIFFPVSFFVVYCVFVVEIFRCVWAYVTDFMYGYNIQNMFNSADSFSSFDTRRQQKRKNTTKKTQKNTENL